MILIDATVFSILSTVFIIVVATSVNVVYKLVAYTLLTSLLWLHGGEFLEFSYSQIFDAPNMYMIIYWILSLTMLLPIPFLARPRARKTSIVLWRKFFHLIVLVLFVPPLVMHQGEFDGLVALAGTLMLCLLVTMEMFRVLRKPWETLSLLLNRLIYPLLDNKDQTSSIVTSHLELLFAAVFPVWLALVVGGPFAQRDYVIAGLVTVGVGDSAAAIGGMCLTAAPHKLPWPRHSKKSLEGFLSFLISTNTVLVFLGSWNYASCFACILAGLFEASMPKYDNAILPIAYSFSRLAFVRIRI